MCNNLVYQPCVQVREVEMGFQHPSELPIIKSQHLIVWSWATYHRVSMPRFRPHAKISGMTVKEDIIHFDSDEHTKGFSKIADALAVQRKVMHTIVQG